MFFYGKSLAACILSWTLPFAVASPPSLAAAHPGGTYAPGFPSRSQWHVATDKALAAFAQIHDEPVSKVHHSTLSKFTLTAYCLDKKSTGKIPGSPGFGITASGTHAQVGRTVAVDPTVIPIGSLLYLPHIGWRIAEDSGGSVKGRHIDVLFDSQQQALAFGVKKHVSVYLYD